MLTQLLKRTKVKDEDSDSTLARLLDSLWHFQYRKLLFLLGAALVVTLLIRTSGSRGHEKKHRSLYDYASTTPRADYCGMRESEVGWFLHQMDAPSDSELHFQISVYLETMTLTPCFAEPFKLKKNTEIVTNSNYWKISENGKSLVLSVWDYVNHNVTEDEFLIDFDPGYADKYLVLHFDILDFENVDISEWDGFGDRDTKLGEGGFGLVHRVRHKVYDIEMALKRGDAKPRNFNEVDMMKNFRNGEHIINFYGTTIVENDNKNARYDHLYMLMELMDGDTWKMFKTLKKLVKSGKLTKDIYLDYIRYAGKVTIESMLYLRSLGYGHLDFKTPNLLFREIGEMKFQLKMIDFGTAKLEFDKNNEYQTWRTVVTTWPYRPPEQEYRGRRYDSRIDQFSTGSTIFELITGRYPFTGPAEKNPRKLFAEKYMERINDVRDLENCDYCWEGIEMDADAKDFVVKLMKYDPSERMSYEDALDHEFIRKCPF